MASTSLPGGFTMLKTTQPRQSSPSRETHRFKQHDDVAIEADVIGSQLGATRPCVVWIHGGGLIFGWRKTSPRASLLHALLDRGFVVVSIDHRLAPETKLPEIVDDVRDAWQWIHEFGHTRFGIDPRRVAVAGASSGAYLALIAGYSFEPRPRALASFWGFGDITGAWEAEPSEHYRKMPLVTHEEAKASLDAPPFAEAGPDRSAFYLYCRQQGRWLEEVTGRDPIEAPGWFDRYCPVRNVTERFPSTILVHGDADTGVPHQESERLAARLAEVGVHHRFISLNGIGHGFEHAQPEQTQAVETEVADFLVSALR